MPAWIAKNVWADRDVFIVGGGSSLDGFQWSRLYPECTIGVNDAYSLGSQAIKVCFFGDRKWYKAHSRPLSRYQGALFSNAPQLWVNPPDDVWVLRRELWGLYQDRLGWYENSGASAINLALIFGARRVYLLGFDCNFGEGKKSHWHKMALTPPSQVLYDRFCENFQRLADDLPASFPGREIINVTDCSQIEAFPKIDPKTFWAERRAPGGVAV